MTIVITLILALGFGAPIPANTVGGGPGITVNPASATSGAAAPASTDNSAGGPGIVVGSGNTVGGGPG